MKLLQHRLVQAALTALTLAVVPMAGAAQTCPDVSLTGQAIDQSAGGLAGGMAFPVVAGGPIDIGLCSDVPGTGFLAESPDFELMTRRRVGVKRMRFGHPSFKLAFSRR